MMMESCSVWQEKPELLLNKEKKNEL